MQSESYLLQALIKVNQGEDPKEPLQKAEALINQGHDTTEQIALRSKVLAEIWYKIGDAEKTQKYLEISEKILENLIQKEKNFN